MTVIVFTALVWKVIDFLRMLFNFKTNKSGVITQITAWVGGVVLVILASHATITQTLVLPGTDQALKGLDIGSLVFIGLLISSVASAAVDIKKAVDNTDSATKPALLSKENQGSV